MNIRIIVPVLFIVCVVVACAGCTGTQGTQPAGGSGSAGSAGSAATAPGSSLAPGPTDAMPDNIAVVVNVGEKDYTGSIPVIFQGGLGQVNVKKIDVKLTRTDGSTQTLTLGTSKGDEVDLDGTRGTGSLQGQPDRVEVWVTMYNGVTYKTVDVTREYRTR
jgi:hypothetical protein